MKKIEMQATSVDETIEYEEIAVLSIDDESLTSLRETINILEARQLQLHTTEAKFVADVEWPDLVIPLEGSFEIEQSQLAIGFDTLELEARSFRVIGSTHDQAYHFRSEDLPIARLIG